jgi:choline dehydrogenase-like flavoprotein
VHTCTRAVIIGSGIAGSSIAYHLAELGWFEVVVLEQGPLISGLHRMLLVWWDNCAPRIVYGYLPIKYATPGTGVEAQLFGVRYGATVKKEPLYDPKNEKIKA